MLERGWEREAGISVPSCRDRGGIKGKLKKQQKEGTRANRRAASRGHFLEGSVPTLFILSSESRAQSPDRRRFNRMPLLASSLQWPGLINVNRQLCGGYHSAKQAARPQQAFLTQATYPFLPHPQPGTNTCREPRHGSLGPRSYSGSTDGFWVP